MAFLVLAGLLAAGGPAIAAGKAHATTKEAKATKARRPVLLDLSAEYYLPLHDDRQVHSVFSNALVGVELVRVIGFAVYGGITVTGAWGDIIQLDEHFNDVKYETAAFGAGPVFLVRLEPIRVGGFAAGIELLGGIIVYTDRFPPGGDIYNFAWRMGGLLSHQVTDRVRLEIGVRWMHVSNGQGLGPFNPSYEGLGFLLGVQMDL